MADVREVTCSPRWKRTLWFFVGLGATGAVLAAVGLAYAPGLLYVWAAAGLLFALVGLASLRAVTARVRADAYGLHFGTLLRRRRVPWRDVADLRVYLKVAKNYPGQDSRRVILVLRDGRKRFLPLPYSGSPDDDRTDFDAKLDALRAQHRRHGTPQSRHLHIVSNHTAGYGWAGALSLCVLLLAFAGGAAWSVPGTASYAKAWKSAAPCTAQTPASERGECLTTLAAVIARTEATRSRQDGSRLYFTDGRVPDRVEVSREAAQTFRPGDWVDLTFWRGQVRKIAGERHVWREHVPTAGDAAVTAAGCALAAGYPGAMVLLRLRGRRLPDDEVLPSALPFAGALLGTALWLLPLCYLHPTDLLASPPALAWGAAGSLATVGLCTWAWRATRVRKPEPAGAADATAEAEEKEEVFLAARFLDHTDYNPYGFGTHIVLGAGPPAVTPHSGPERFAAKRIPVERLTLGYVRRARGSDGDTVPRDWHIAELDDSGKPVRLAAAPANLTRILRELRPAETPAHTATPEP